MGRLLVALALCLSCFAFPARTEAQVWSSFGGIHDGCDGVIYAEVLMPNGDVIAGGQFGICGDAPANNVARWDGSSWHSLGSGAENGVVGQVYALAAVGSDVYVAGNVGKAGSTYVNSIAKWDGAGWSAVGSGSDNGVYGSVYCMTAVGSSLYVGGYFGQAAGSSLTANNIAKWDGANWSSLGSGAGNGTGAAVRGIQAIGSSVYVGGEFITAGGNAANYLALWNGVAWSTVGTNALNGNVESMAVSGNDLYIGGDFTMADATPANHVAVWHNSAWHSLGTGTANGVDRALYAIAFDGSDVYVGGGITQAGGAPAFGIAKWNGSTWSSLTDGPSNGAYAPYAIVVNAGKIYVAGTFLHAGLDFGVPNVVLSHIGLWDGSAWQALGAGTAFGINGPVNSLAKVGASMYAGGSFSEAGSVAANNIARWDTATGWHALGTGAQNGVDGLSTDVLATDGTVLYVAGGFSQAGNIQATRIAMWDGSAWNPLGTGIPGTINALAVIGSDLYAAGYFTVAGGTSVNNIARWHGGVWSALGNGVSNGVDDTVTSLTASGTNLYVGGLFTHAGGAAAAYIAKWDGSTWASLDGLQGNVAKLGVLGTDIYASGSMDNPPYVYLQQWNGAAWNPVAGAPDNAASAMLSSTSLLYVGADFSGDPLQSWDGAQWASLSFNPNNLGTPKINSIVATSGRNLYVGGSFAIAGSAVSGNIACIYPCDRIFSGNFE